MRQGAESRGKGKAGEIIAYKGSIYSRIQTHRKLDNNTLNV